MRILRVPIAAFLPAAVLLCCSIIAADDGVADDTVTDESATGAPSPAASDSAAGRATIAILDEAGRTQSLVETQPGSKGTVKVFVKSPDGAGLEGVTVFLSELPSKDPFGSSQSLASGIASFFEVPVGSYQVTFECGELDFNSVVVSPMGGAAAAAPDTDSVRAEREEINLVDSKGSSRAIGEMAIGDKASISLVVQDSAGSSTKSVRVRLVELSADRELEVVDEQVSGTDGKVTFANVSGGDYKLELAGCSERYQLAGIGVFGYPITGLICPPGAAVKSIADAQGISGSDALTRKGSGGEIKIVDEDGRTQSLVESGSDGFGTVRVFVRDANEEGLPGVRLALVSAESGKDFAEALTRDRGVATFFKVPPGAYRVAFDCGSLQLDSVEVSAEAAPGTGSTISILDSAGSTRAVSEVAPGAQASVNVRLAGVGEQGESVSGITLQLVELQGEKGIEAVSEAKTSASGEAAFSGVRAGDYKVLVRECSSRGFLSGVGLFDVSTSGVVCGPPAALGLGAGGGGGAASTQSLVTAFGVTPAAGVSAGTPIIGIAAVGAASAGVGAQGVTESTDSNGPPPTISDEGNGAGNGANSGGGNGANNGPIVVPTAVPPVPTSSPRPTGGNGNSNGGNDNDGGNPTPVPTLPPTPAPTQPPPPPPTPVPTIPPLPTPPPVGPPVPDDPMSLQAPPPLSPS